MLRRYIAWRRGEELIYRRGAEGAEKGKTFNTVNAEGNGEQREGEGRRRGPEWGDGAQPRVAVPRMPIGRLAFPGCGCGYGGSAGKIGYVGGLGLGTGYGVGGSLWPTNFLNSGSSWRQARSASFAAQKRLPNPAAKAFLSVSRDSVFLPSTP